MIRLICYIRPHKLEGVKTALAALGITGMNVTDVRGVGNSPERATWLGGEQHLIALPIKSKIEVVAPDDLQEAMIQAILEHAATGEPGDGKMFVEKVSDALRIRTRERGETAL